MKVLIRKNDKVQVIAGRERGKTGKVLRVFAKEGRILISGLNMVKRNIRPTQDMPQGGSIEKESPINISNVMIYCDKCGRAVRIGIKKLPDNTKMRYCKKCELEI